MIESTKQYATRSAMELDKAGGYFMRHMEAMTVEDLRGKFEIAAELAWRDMRIDQLRANSDRAQISELRGQLIESELLEDSLRKRIAGLEREVEKMRSGAATVAPRPADETLAVLRNIVAAFGTERARNCPMTAAAHEALQDARALLDRLDGDGK